MKSIAEEADRIYRRRVLRAREMDPVQKMWDGPRLFEGVVRRMRAGIRVQLVTGDEEKIDAELRRRLAVLDKVRQLE